MRCCRLVCLIRCGKCAPAHLTKWAGVSLLACPWGGRRLLSACRAAPDPCKIRRLRVKYCLSDP